MDNDDGDVDFIAQELRDAGIEVKLDRWNLQAGEALWDQIAQFITDPDESDAWVLYASQNSLQSPACQEEFAYALGRALDDRGGGFPIIGLFNGPVNKGLIPEGVKVRLCVTTTDPNWKERICAAAEGRDASIKTPRLQPFYMSRHQTDEFPHVIEVRPRAGSWSPFVAAIPRPERDDVQPRLRFGPAGNVPAGGVLFQKGEGPSDDGSWWVIFAQNESTPTQSYYICVEELPSSIVFGVHRGEPQYHLDVAP